MNRSVYCVGLSLALVSLAAACGGSTQEPVQCAVSGVAVTPSPGTVAVGGTTQFAAAVTQQNCSNLTTTWDTGDHAKATVSATGLVTGVAAGTTTVSATVSGHTGSVTLTVLPPPCQVTSVTLSPPAKELVPNETVALTATIASQNCTGLTPTWSSSNETVAVVNSGGIVTALSPGAATITATVAGVPGTAAITVSAPSFGSTWTAATLKVAGLNGSPTGFATAAWASSPIEAFIASGGDLFRYNNGGWQKYSFDGTGVQAMWGSSNTDVFGVGTHILHWNGSAWAAMTDPITQTLRSVWGSSATSIFAVGDAGAIIQYNGTTWSSVTSPTTANLRGVSGSGAGFALAVAETGEIYKYNGTSWSLQSNLATFLDAVWVASPTSAFAVGQGGHVYRFDGTTWSDIAQLLNGNLTAVWGTSPTDVYVAGELGYVAHFDGATWTPIPPKTATLFTVLTGSGSGVFGLGDGFVVGLTPSTETLISYAPTLNSVWAVDANTAFAVGDGGTVWMYSSGTWQLQNTGVLYRLTDVWAESANEVIAVGSSIQGNGGVVLRYNGTSWNEATIPASSGQVSVWGPAFDKVVSASRFSRLLGFDGCAWTQVSPAPPGDIIAMWGTSATDYTMVGSNLAVRFDGVTVTPLASIPTSDAPISLWGSSPTNYFAGTNNGAMFRFNGSTWSQMTVATQGAIVSIWGTGPSEIFALTNDGEVGKFNGTTWSRVKLSDPSRQFKAIHGTATRLFAVGAAGAVMVTP